MKNSLLIVLFMAALAACSNSKKEKAETTADSRIMLRADTLNVVKLADTMIIYESTCRGCAYEQSTDFSISDSLNIVELDHVETHDNNPSNMDGGSIHKNLILVPKKAGKTIIRMYKFWGKPATAKDSANFTSYTIEVKN